MPKTQSERIYERLYHEKLAKVNLLQENLAICRKKNVEKAIELVKLQSFITHWEGHASECDSLDEGSPRTDCTCGYTAARLEALRKEDNTK